MKKVTKIGKSYRFQAAHQLIDHDGLCSNIHGHSYKIEVVLTGRISSSGAKNGMIVDFYDLDSIVKKRILDKLDHAFICSGREKNFTDMIKNGMKVFNLRKEATVENIASWAYNDLCVAMDHSQSGSLVEVVSVKVWETEDSWAEVSMELDDGGGCGLKCEGCDCA
jgi:6-pyruvoyltetrahydropterin/6-carboxytetrahydropterin synthase